MNPDKFPDAKWWQYEPPPTAYDVVGNNIITNSIRPFLYIFVRLYFKSRHKLVVSGYRSLYADRSFIIIANHASHLDTPLIFSCFPCQRTNNMRAVAALDYFFSNPLLRMFAHLLCNIIPIDREAADFVSLSMCRKTLNAGGTIILYPEGTRTRTGKMGEFKPGIGVLVKKLKMPLLPLFIEGTYKCYNYRRTLPSAGYITVSFGSPIEFDTGLLDSIDYKEITSRIQNMFFNMPGAANAKANDAS